MLCKMFQFRCKNKMQKSNSVRMKYSNSDYNKSLQKNANDLRKNAVKSEACLWKYVLNKRRMRGYSFRRQRPVLGYIVDFVCLPLKLVIEVDGITHHDDDRARYDKIRDTTLEKAGYSVMRFSATDVLNEIRSVTNAIEVWIEEWEKKNL